MEDSALIRIITYKENPQYPWGVLMEKVFLGKVLNEFHVCWSWVSLFQSMKLKEENDWRVSNKQQTWHFIAPLAKGKCLLK